MMKYPIQMAQVLLLFEEKNSADYGLALWAALHEAEAFYNFKEQRLDIRRFYISPYVPTSGFLETLKNAAKYFTSSEVKNALDLLTEDERVQTTLPGDEARNPDAKTYNQERLITVTRDQLLRTRFGAAAEEMHLMIITDRPITPPEDWRYVIWDSWLTPQPNAVVSTTPLDPEYWQISDPQRVGTIKDRARTAVMSLCGTFLGLHRCHNPKCFLFENVASVTNLDRMNTLGKEHGSEIEGLIGAAFQRGPSDPSIVQPVLRT
jgi:predicted Zn-dependent protease